MTFWHLDLFVFEMLTCWKYDLCKHKNTWLWWCVFSFFLCKRSSQSVGPFVFSTTRKPCLCILATLTHTPKYKKINSDVCFFFTNFVFVVFITLYDDSKSVALYSAYVYTPQNTRKSTRNYGLVYNLFLAFLCYFLMT